jgi:hypothetical protein
MNKLSQFLLILFSAILLQDSTLAQCEVDAGEDIVACILNANQEDTIRLDGQLISGDIVSFSWSAKTSSDGRDVTTQLLGDADRLDPFTEIFIGEYVTVSLTGTTSDNQTCVDSMSLIFSTWDYTFANTSRVKGPEDTIQIFGAAFSNAQLNTYQWSPNYNISDITLRSPQVWNDTTVVYFSNIMDTLGCVETNDSFTSIVSTTSVDEVSKVYDFSIYPNPTSAVINIKSDERISSLKLRTIDGSLISKSKGSKIDVSQIHAGNYLIQIVFSDGEIRMENIVISK